MHQLSIEHRLAHYGDVSVVLARDARRRYFMGVPAGRGDDRTHLFVEIDRVTWLELERGQVPLYTVMAERGIGLVVESKDCEVEEGLLSLDPA